MSNIDAKSIYEQASENYRHFLAWREKIFAGYLTILAALALAYAKTEPNHDSHKVAILGATIVVSVVFWILDLRTTAFFTACQRAGANLEAAIGSLGAYSELRALIPPNDKRRLSHGLAVNALVSAVIAGACAGIWLRSGWLMANWGVIPIGSIVAPVVSEILFRRARAARRKDAQGRACAELLDELRAEGCPRREERGTHVCIYCDATFTDEAGKEPVANHAANCLWLKISPR